MSSSSRRYPALFGLLLCLAIAFAPALYAQKSPGQPFPFQLGLAWPAQTAGGASFGAFAVTGLQYFSVDWIVSGTISACTVTLDGGNGVSFTTGSIVSSQTCTSTGTFTTSSATQNVQAQLTYSITGSGRVTFVVRGFVINPANTNCAIADVLPRARPHAAADRKKSPLNDRRLLLVSGVNR